MVKKLRQLLLVDLRSTLRSVVMLQDSPHSIALGAAIGIFIGLTPTVGIQMLLVLSLAFLCRPLFHFNRVAAVMAVYISNPLTIVPLYFAEYKLGTLFVQGNVVTRARFEQLLANADFSSRGRVLFDLFIDVGWPLVIGTAIVSVCGGIIAYPTTRMLIRWYHARGRQTAQQLDVTAAAVSQTEIQSKQQQNRTIAKPRAVARAN